MLCTCCTSEQDVSTAEVPQDIVIASTAEAPDETFNFHMKSSAKLKTKPKHVSGLEKLPKHVSGLDVDTVPFEREAVETHKPSSHQNASTWLHQPVLPPRPEEPLLGGETGGLSPFDCVTAGSKSAWYRSQIALIDAKLDEAKHRLRFLKAKGAPSAEDSESGATGVTALSRMTDNHEGPKQGRQSTVDEIIAEEKEDGTWMESEAENQKAQKSHRSSVAEMMMAHDSVNITGSMNETAITGSALGYPKIVELSIFAVAIGGFIFTLIAESEHLGHDESDADHRRLAAGPAQVVKDICWIVAVAGALATVAHGLYLPLVLGYLLGGFIVGPVGADIVIGGPKLLDITRLGVLFVLFMLGLEIDMVGLWQSKEVRLSVGILTVPICSGLAYVILLGLDSAGISFGSGEHTLLYCAVCSSFSSLAIVQKLLYQKNQMEAAPSILSCGILMVQALWSTIGMALQPHIDHPEAVEILKTLGWAVLLLAVNYVYAKYIMPSVLYSAEKSIELLLVVSLSWCFFVASIGLLPFIELPMEVSALLAGTTLASFPYSLGFTQKIKYIRDFFLTLFFATLGAEMPNPTMAILGKACLVAGVVLVLRWLSIFLVALPASGGRSAMISTLNLSQISELSLIVCMIGKQYNHIDDETQAIFVWAFFILAICSSLFILQSDLIFRVFMSFRLVQSSSDTFGRFSRQTSDEDYKDSRAVVLLGFSKVSHMLLAELKASGEGMLRHIHVIHPDAKTGLKDSFVKVGIKFTNADFTSKDDLDKSQLIPPEIAICTTPGSLLAQISANNADLIKSVKEVWPETLVIVTEESASGAKDSYEAGADYVLRMAKLCASRLLELFTNEADKRHGHSWQRYSHLQQKDADKRGGSVFWSEGFGHMSH